MSADGVPGDLLEQCVELRFVVVAHVFERLESTGHGQADGAFAVNNGVVAVAGENLQRWIGVTPGVAEKIALGFEAGAFT